MFSSTEIFEMLAILDASGDRDIVAVGLDIGRSGGHVHGAIYRSRSGSCKSASSCRLCGVIVATWATKWRKPAHAYASEAAHACAVRASDVAIARANLMREIEIVRRAETETETERATLAIVAFARWIGYPYMPPVDLDRVVARQRKRILDRTAARIRRAA